MKKNIQNSPIYLLNSKRKIISNKVLKHTLNEYSSSNIRTYIEEALYLEKKRIRKESFFNSDALMFFGRIKKDASFWKKVKYDLIHSSSDSSYQDILKKIINHYNREISSSFNKTIYSITSIINPWFFSWILNISTRRKFLPFYMDQKINSKILIKGEKELIKKLSNKGTIILVSTHQSHIDSILISYIVSLMGLPPFSYGAGFNLFTNYFISFILKNIGTYSIDIKKRNSIYKSVLKNYSTQMLIEGIHSVFFPGGSRVRSGAIENKLKLGLLGTGVRAQTQNYMNNSEKPNVYIVPMVLSYHYVIEANKLIEEFFERTSHRSFMGNFVEDSLSIRKVINFLWKFCSVESPITARIGRPLDIFGNTVDDRGNSIGPNSTIIDPKKWLTTCGRLCESKKRDNEYTKELGKKIIDRFYETNTVLSSHAVSFNYLFLLRKKHSNLDIYQFIRLSYSQKFISINDFEKNAHLLEKELFSLKEKGRLNLSEEFYSDKNMKWIHHGIKKLEVLHRNSVIKKEGNNLYSDNLLLLYYYRNRLSGYGIFSDFMSVKKACGEYDDKGFLA